MSKDLVHLAQAIGQGQAIASLVPFIANVAGRGAYATFKLLPAVFGAEVEISVLHGPGSALDIGRAHHLGMGSTAHDD